MNINDFLATNAINYESMSTVTFYLVIVLGGVAALAGIASDLTRGHRRFRDADVEARRHNHTEKIR